tara:strand:+ start:25 stop:330 length:306 start_codon:yes stop_codon:yes gene_type:complete
MKEKSWSQIILEYNCPYDQKLNYEYRNSDQEGNCSDNNLRYCEKCKSVYERRYEQQLKLTVVYRYKELCQWQGTIFQSIPDKHVEECQSKGCSGDMHVFNY